MCINEQCWQAKCKEQNKRSKMQLASQATKRREENNNLTSGNEFPGKERVLLNFYLIVICVRFTMFNTYMDMWLHTTKRRRMRCTVCQCLCNSNGKQYVVFTWLILFAHRMCNAAKQLIRHNSCKFMFVTNCDFVHILIYHYISLQSMQHSISVA